jgi:hypothetical protein
MKGTKENKRRGATKGYLPNQWFARDQQHNWSSYNPYPASTTSMSILWNFRYVRLPFMALF